MGYYYLDGNILSTKDGISPFDLGIHRSFAVFDYCVFRENVIIYFEDYIQRFRNSIQGMDLSLELSNKDLFQTVHSLIRKNKMNTGGIKFVFTGGASHNAYDLDKPSLLIFILPIPVYPDNFFSLGMKLINLEYVRSFPKIKSTNYFVSLAYRKRLEQQKAQDFIYHWNGNVSESSRSNLFLVKNGIIKTPKEDILEGVTRKHVIRISKNLAPLEICDLSLADFFQADEVFLTSTTKRIMPVRQIDSKHFNPLGHESITKVLMNTWMQEEQNYIQTHKI